MGRLIDDLLAFSRLSRTGMKAVLIDMTALASSVFQVLTTPEERGRIDFRVAPLPSIIGDPTLLHQAWSNLIGNAIKFSGAMPRAMIEIKAIQKDNEAVYFVSDNGAGFDMQYADKLFGIFQRLHRESEFKGNGVGLAIVQRVIRRHGGRVWAESEVGKGSTFYFGLPCRGER
jgi:light-regulated signal transduction histidine kinase (bacteriophytochrome)